MDANIDRRLMTREEKQAVWNRFDYIGLVCFTEYKNRVEALNKELDRIGLLGRVHYHWDFPNPFEDKLISVLHFQCERTRKAFHCGYNNYSIIKTAYNLGCCNVLILEDDVRFLKDINDIASTIRLLPENYDLAMMDKNWPTQEFGMRNQILENQVNERWISFDRFLSSGCYAMSRKGMRRFIAKYEGAALSGNGNLLKSNDQYFNRGSLGDDLNLIAAQPNLCCQGYIGNGWCPTDLKGYWDRHESTGMKQKDYNLDLPVVTKTTFLEALYGYLGNSLPRKRIQRIFVASNSYLIKAAIEKDVTEEMDDKEVGYVCIWGNRGSDTNCRALQIAYRWKAQILLAEDGFIRSINTWVGNYGNSRNRSHSVLIDSKAYYFDATRESDLEAMLNDFNLVVTPEQRIEAHRLIDKIVSNKISKYNHQPIYTPQIGRKGVSKVLVVDQSYGDFSIHLGLADDSTFDKMLQAAIEENPEADILVKTHPDTLAGKVAGKKGYYQDLKENNNIYKVTNPINPYSLLEICDKVYVCSSQFGLEALMAGKEVHVFGMPFYAGWGLTIDRQHLERRVNMRTLDELFYIFYCLYTHWIDPDKGCKTTIEAVIDKMIVLRDEYTRNPNSLSCARHNNSGGYRLGYKTNPSHPKVYLGRQTSATSARCLYNTSNW